MKKKCGVIILPQTIAYRFFLRGAQWQKEQLLVEIEKAESESFEGWSEEAKNGYLTALCKI